MGRQPLRSLRRVDRRAMNAPADRPVRPARRADRPRPPGPRAVHRRPAARRDRQGAVARRPGHRDGRADRGAVRRSRSSGCSPWPAALRDAGAALLFISHRFEEISALCQRVTVHARRPARLHRPARRPHRRRDGPPHGRPATLGALFPKQRRRPGRGACWRCAGSPGAGRVPRRVLRGARRGDRRARRAGRRRALARSCARCSASTGRDAGTVRVARPRAARRARRRAAMAAGHRAGPRGPPPAGPGAGGLDRAQRHGHALAAAWPASGCCSAAPSGAPPRSGPRGCRPSTPASTTRWRGCPAATSRRSCWPSGWRPSRGC